MFEEEYFEQGDSCSSHIYPMQAGNIKKGGYAMLKGCPCKIVDMTTSKAGKHGHAKATFIGVDIFTGKKCDDSCPTSHNMEIPFVKKVEYQLTHIDEDGYISLLVDNKTIKEDLKLPKEEPELSQKIREDFAFKKDLLISIISAMG